MYIDYANSASLWLSHSSTFKHVYLNAEEAMERKYIFKLPDFTLLTLPRLTYPSMLVANNSEKKTVLRNITVTNYSTGKKRNWTYGQLVIKQFRYKQAHKENSIIFGLSIICC